MITISAFAWAPDFANFNLDDIDAASVRVRDGGGQVLMGPSEVPGGGWIINATDPEGAVFALTGRRV